MSIFYGAMKQIHGRRTQESRDKQIHWHIVQLSERADLDELAMIHDGNTVTQSSGFQLVMCDVDAGDLVFLQQAFQLGPGAGAKLGIQVGEWLVK